MPTVLIFATKGAEDPTGATTPLIVARGLQETGDDVQIVFMAQGFVPVPFQ
jgi:predicted peroxiredoxin